MKFDIIMVGCGVMANYWLGNITLRKDCEIIALVDLDIRRAAAIREKYNLECNIYDLVDEALEKEHGNLLIDLTYVTVHHDVTIKALRAGYNVIGEKPMAFEVEQANDMLRAADETGKRYIVAQNRRYIDQVEKIRELVISGDIGEPVFICGEIFDCKDNIHSIAMVFASVKSIREKREVGIEVNETYPYIVLD